MPEHVAESRRISRKRIWTVAIGAFLLTAVQCVALVVLVRRVGLEYPVLWHVPNVALSILPPILVGFVAHALAGRFQRTGWDYVRAVTRPAELLLFLLLLAALILQIVFYSGLKVMVPLLTDRSFDEALWQLDSWLFLGMSPSVFFVNLLDNSILLRFIDFGYGYFFFFSALLSFPLFFPLRDARLRVSFITANMLLWCAGAWLYFAVPSLGPAYGFHQVWDAVREQFPVSTYWQKQLLDNYQLVLKIAEGTIDRELNMYEGIGAFPSLHVGFQALFALYLGRLSKMAQRVAWLLLFLTFLGSVLTGWHYLIDSIAGVVLAVGVFLLMERVVLPSPLEGTEGETTP